jgi:Xaa-Pro dipeptidase
MMDKQKVSILQKWLYQHNCNRTFLIELKGTEFNPNYYYFTGYDGVGILDIPGRGKVILQVPKMEFSRAKKSFAHTTIFEKNKMWESVKKSSQKASVVGLDYSDLTLLDYQKLKKSVKRKKTIDISQCLTNLRVTKTDQEIDYIKKSCKIAGEIIEDCVDNFSRFRTEQEVCTFLKKGTLNAGCDLAFPPICASGKNSSIPHHTPQSKLGNGFCVIDFGVRYKEYCSDISRTVFLGAPQKKDRELYEKVLAIQEDLIDSCSTHVSGADLFSLAHQKMGSLSPFFTHGLGHGIGLEIHELPNLKSEGTPLLKENMVFTIEPGVYFPKYGGIRIEDDILLKNRPKLLTKVSKEFLAIKGK